MEDSKAGDVSLSEDDMMKEWMAFQADLKSLEALPLTEEDESALQGASSVCGCARDKS